MPKFFAAAFVFAVLIATALVTNSAQAGRCDLSDFEPGCPNNIVEQSDGPHHHEVFILDDERVYYTHTRPNVGECDYTVLRSGYPKPTRVCRTGDEISIESGHWLDVITSVDEGGRHHVSAAHFEGNPLTAEAREELRNVIDEWLADN